MKSPILLDRHVVWVEYLNKQPKNNSIDPENELNETDILSVAYLKKEIKFGCKLNEDFGNERLSFNGKIDVDFFGRYGTDDPAYKSKLRIHDYINNDDFIFEIEAESNEDKVNFAKVIPDSTLEETNENLIAGMNKDNLVFLGHNDQVKIPYIRLCIKKEFNEVEGAKILNEGFGEYSIAGAIRLIDFDLNESGITVESIAETYSTLSFHAKEPKKLIFDKPFLIILKICFLI